MCSSCSRALQLLRLLSSHRSQRSCSHDRALAAAKATRPTPTTAAPTATAAAVAATPRAAVPPTAVAGAALRCVTARPSGGAGGAAHVSPKGSQRAQKESSAPSTRPRGEIGGGAVRTAVRTAVQTQCSCSGAVRREVAPAWQLAELAHQPHAARATHAPHVRHRPHGSPATGAAPPSHVARTCHIASSAAAAAAAVAVVADEQPVLTRREAQRVRDARVAPPLRRLRARPAVGAVRAVRTFLVLRAGAAVVALAVRGEAARVGAAGRRGAEQIAPSRQQPRQRRGGRGGGEGRCAFQRARVI